MTMIFNALTHKTKIGDHAQEAGPGQYGPSHHAHRGHSQCHGEKYCYTFIASVSYESDSGLANSSDRIQKSEILSSR